MKVVTNNWREDGGKEATVACRLCANLHTKAGRVTVDEGEQQHS